MVYRLANRKTIDIELVHKDQVHIGNFIFDEFGREVIRRHNERFEDEQGKKLQNLRTYDDGQLIEADIPRVLSYAQIVRELARENPDLAVTRVFTFEDAVRFSRYIPEGSILSSVFIYPAEDHEYYYERLRKKVLGFIGLTKIDLPLIVDGLNSIEGYPFFDLEKTDNIRVREAPYLERKETSVRYNPRTGEIVQCPADKGVTLRTPEKYKHDSFGGFFHSSHGISADVGFSGSVRLIQCSELKDLRDRMLNEYQTMRRRFHRALNYIGTGELPERWEP